jgi:hypothetical protein
MKLTGARRQCSACAEYFNSQKSFERHRIGLGMERRCRTREEMIARGFAVNAAGFWVTEAWRKDEP